MDQLVTKHSDSLPVSTKLAIDVVVRERASIGCTPLFVYIPNSNYWRPDARAKYYANSIQNYVSSLKSRPEFIDTTYKLLPLGLSAYAPIGPHLSVEGYKIVAEAIKEKIVAVTVRQSVLTFIQ